MRQLTRLMIIDDELHDIGFMMQFFQERIEGCAFETFSSAEEALARLHFEGERGDNPVLAEDPDIIILDLKLGAMNGFDFLKALRKDEHPGDHHLRRQLQAGGGPGLRARLQCHVPQAGLARRLPGHDRLDRRLLAEDGAPRRRLISAL
jgi:CheY-like chemotaxis protein